jgi:hypothetical protein
LTIRDEIEPQDRGEADLSGCIIPGLNVHLYGPNFTPRVVRIHVVKASFSRHSFITLNPSRPTNRLHPDHGGQHEEPAVHGHAWPGIDFMKLHFGRKVFVQIFILL